MKLFWQPEPVHVYVMSFGLDQNCQMEGKKNRQQTWHTSQGQQSLFFPSDYPLFKAVISGFEACLAQNNVV